MAAQNPDNARLLAGIERAAEGFRAELDRLAEESVPKDSVLPGWTRGHVLAHVAGVCNGMARQLEYAARGELIPLYDGGAEGRNREIEEGAPSSADEHRERTSAALDRALAAFRTLEGRDWERPISYRDGAVRDGGLALWRELVIHRTDLGTGESHHGWEPEFCEHLAQFLAPRVPAGMRFVLHPEGGAPQLLGDGDDAVDLHGRLTDLVAWLAGRPVEHAAVRAERAGQAVPLPEIGPWPAAQLAK
ncbi:maleylpyruvate isomerase family mycothiol-dependent enzyme [Sinomonas halotolerans]|uniref:Maleylpyruvate isomerase family mycothiol-dependent enzyme n=1 Tax=Sinomonas halotolerans TaxID=1644133 RepID=A0ABU9X3T8_9MICC